MLITRNLTLRHGSRPLLDGIGLTARPGQVTAIIGPSGAGKSTLLKALSGDLAFAGEIALNGHDLRALKPAQMARIRAVLPQATPLAFPFTVAEVVRMGLLGPHRQDGISRQALLRVGLGGFEPRYYQDLSGGEQQRVQLARVLCQVWNPVGPDGHPCWLLLDEPVSSLDIGHQLQVMQIVRDFARQGGGVVMVMHDLNLTAMSADSVVLLQAGRVLAQDAPAQVLRSDLLSRAYGCRLTVCQAPADCAYVLPQVARAG